MTPTAVSDTPEEQDIFIPDHTLYGEYPAKIPEAEIKTEAETGEIVLSRVVIPEYIIRPQRSSRRFQRSKLLCPL